MPSSCLLPRIALSTFLVPPSAILVPPLLNALQPPQQASGKLDKFLEKRRKKNAAKDHRYLPSTRRQAGGED